MIREILDMIEAELGAPLPGECKTRVVLRAHQELGGESYYLPKAPKGVTMQRIVDLGTALPANDVAAALGVSPRYVRKIRGLLRG